MSFKRSNLLDENVDVSYNILSWKLMKKRERRRNAINCVTTNMPILDIKPTSRQLTAYYAELEQLEHLNITNETAVREPFPNAAQIFRQEIELDARYRVSDDRTSRKSDFRGWGVA